MRRTGLALVMVSVFAGVGPARAGHDYPWCAQGGENDYPGECYYQTYQQCQASVSGRLLFCGPNPRVGYGQPQQRVPQQPQSARRGRTIHPN